jgi:hypothetical protein
MAICGKSPRNNRLAFAGALALASFLQAPLSAQSPAPAAKPAPPNAKPRAKEPDLQGIWGYATITPLERPRDLGTQQFFTKAEADAFERQVQAENDKDRRDGSAEADVARAYNEAWWDRGTHVVTTLRTSIITDPPDGRVPALSASARAAQQARQANLARPPRGPEDRSINERCIVGSPAGPPFLPSAYNNNIQISQSPGYVVILNEMIHDYRVIPTNNSAHLPSRFRFWMGDPRGHWEGNTLVVDSTNFNGQIRFRGSDENLHLIERFTLVKPGEILYQFRVEDPSAFEKPWGGEFPLHATKEPIYEYACHEGNYGLANQLAGARAEEEQAAKAAGKKK